MTLRIGDLIEVPPVQTVIKLDDGTSDPGAITSTFVCTEDVTTHLTIFAGALKRDVGKGLSRVLPFAPGIVATTRRRRTCFRCDFHKMRPKMGTEQSDGDGTA